MPEDLAEQTADWLVGFLGAVNEALGVKVPIDRDAALQLVRSKLEAPESVTAEELVDRLASGEWVEEAKAGLVPKKITVKTKAGKTYTKTVMVKPQTKPAAKKPSADDKAASIAAIKKHLATPGHTAASLADLHEHLSKLTVTEIQAIKKEHDLKGGKLKAEHIAKILEFARAMKQGGEPEPEPAPRPVDLRQADPNHPVARAIREDKKAAGIMSQVQGHLGSLQNARKAYQDAAAARDKAVAENLRLEAEVYGPEAKKKTKAAQNKAFRAYMKHLNEVRTPAVERFWESQKEHDKAVGEFRGKVVAALKPESPGTIAHSFDPSVVPEHDLSYSFAALPDTPTARRPFEAATAFVTGITDNLGELPLLFGRSDTGRAFASEGGKRHTVTIGREPADDEGEWARRDNIRAAIHEIGHTVEFHKPGVLQAAREFLQYRVGDEKPTSLKEKFGDSFRPDEEGRKDHFDRAFGDTAYAYYVGKHYRFGYTEVVSMGLEKLHEDPVTLIEHDPEYAQFLFKILSM